MEVRVLNVDKKVATNARIQLMKRGISLSEFIRRELAKLSDEYLKGE